MKHRFEVANNICACCGAAREEIEDNLVRKFCRVPHAAKQRRQAHRRRLALGRAMHQVRAARVGYWTRAAKLRKPWRIQIPRMLRKHAKLLHHTMAVLGS